MRLRNIPGAKEAVHESPFVIRRPETQKGRWNALFDKEQPVHIEIGMGKGRFLREKALREPSVNFIGIERFESVLIKAIRRQQQEELKNLLFICTDATIITEIFAKNEISKIYLNFSDPWPKARHAKRRLVSKEFLRRYDEILVPDGRIEFKTDQEPLFEFGLEELFYTPFEAEKVWRDLYADEDEMKDNIATEYETKFASKGHPIYKMILRRKNGKEIYDSGF